MYLWGSLCKRRVQILDRILGRTNRREFALASKRERDREMEQETRDRKKFNGAAQLVDELVM